jgi:hypothetical protein
MIPPAHPFPICREEKDQCELVHKLIEEHQLDGDYRWLVRSCSCWQCCIFGSPHTRLALT